MRQIWSAIIFVIVVASCSSPKTHIIEASCGQCQLGLKGKGCDLAIKINEKAYFVDGSDIDDHGDAHDSMGLCNAVRKAKVIGEIIDGRFVASSFELIE